MKQIEFFLPSYAKNFIPEQSPEVRDISFLNIAYRPKPEGAATGGAGGVLTVKQNLLGPSYRGFHLRYAYEPKKSVLPTVWSIFAKEQRLGTMAKNLLSAHHYVQNNLQGSLPKPFSARPGALYYFVCHDIGSAVAAHMCGFPFALIYHQQGSFIHERTSFGEQLNNAERFFMNYFEKTAFENADQVFFPSEGAKKAFIATSQVVDMSKVNFGDRPIYNSVIDFDIDETGLKKFLGQNGLAGLMNPSTRNEYMVFISIGDYTQNKGIDRCPDILARIAGRTDKKVLWICMGSKHKSGIYEQFEAEKENWPFKAVLVPTRQDHALTMALAQFADWLFMMQRHSIFDFSTLEAMKLGTGAIFSPVGGNLEFNKENNILYIDPENPLQDQIEAIINADPSYYGDLNKKIFNKYFSPEVFATSYRQMYDNVIDRFLKPKQLSNSGLDLNEIKNIFSGKKVVICGPGESLKAITPEEFEGKILIALNSALTCDLPFDVHVMQDEPRDAALWCDYLSRHITRIYGRINRLATKNLEINFDLLNEAKTNYLSYDLTPTLFDVNFETMDFYLDKHPVFDMAGVLFSAIQIAVSGGATEIELVGIDFSTQNFNAVNPSVYSRVSYINLATVAKAMAQNETPFRVLHSTSSAVQEILASKGEQGIPALPVPKKAAKTQSKNKSNAFRARLNSSGPIKRTILILGDKLLPAFISRPIDIFLQKHKIL